MISDQLLSDAQTLWDYHQLGHTPRRTDIAIGLGSHDIGVAEHAANLYHQGMFPLVVFTGANAPTTVKRFPRGEAVHFTERAVELGVPVESVLQENGATNTGENFTLTRNLLESKGIFARTATIISRPYQQRRAYATARKIWPELDLTCSSHAQSLEEYIAAIGDSAIVLNMLVGDTQRIWVYADANFAMPQKIDPNTYAAYIRLVEEGFTNRLVDSPHTA
ncbi:YdcF family protein [Brachybacterium alimentarium]|uniref:YdcF family protein n=1 Tax=Brachybacterium alimentarium TaxID=47845 RepID=UPI003FCFF415